VREFSIVCIETDLGAGKKGAKLGPKDLLSRLKSKNGTLFSDEKCHFVGYNESKGEGNNPFCHHIDEIFEIQEEVYSTITPVLNSGKFPLIFSGDHSSAAAAISAIKNDNPSKRLGVIWIDAHADLHTPYTTPSGNMHGMSLALVLGLSEGKCDRNDVDKDSVSLWKKMLISGSEKISPKVLFQDLVYMEIRDFEEEERAVIEEHKILCFGPDDRIKSGVEQILNQALQKLEPCDLIYVSFDVDSLDPSISIGTGTPVPNGLSVDNAIYILSQLYADPKVVAIEITEVNPILDRVNPMEDVMAGIIEKVFSNGIQSR